MVRITKYWRTIVLVISASCMTFSCNLLSRSANPQPTHIAEPPRISTTPTPKYGHLGGIDGTFVSVNSTSGYKTGYKCYRVFRLFSDGLVLMHDSMCIEDGTIRKKWSEVNASFDQTTSRASHGEYYQLDGKIWFMIIYDYGFRTAYRDFRGSFTDDGLSLVELNLYSDYNADVPLLAEEYEWLDFIRK